MAGCSAPVEISGTNRDSSYQQKITRVLVTTALRAPDLSARQNEGFVRADEMTKASPQPGRRSAFPSRLSISMPAKARPRRRRGSPSADPGSDARAISSTKFVVDAYTVDASLTDVSTQRRVWRGAVQFKGIMESGRMRHSGLGGTISHQNDADDLVRTLTAKLKADGLL